MGLDSIKRISGAVMVVVLTACAPQPAQPPLSEQMLETDKKNVEATAVPDYISETLLQGAAPGATAPSEKRFDVAVDNIPAKAFFLSLVAETGANVVAHPDVSGSLSLDLKNVTVREVLDVVREIFGYEYRFKDNIYTIFPRKLRTEIFSINYIDIKRVGVADTNVAIGDIKSSDSSSNGNASGNTGTSDNIANILAMAGGEGGQQSNTQGPGISPGSRVQTLNKTDFWQTLGDTIKLMIDAPNEGRNVMVSPQAGLIAVTAMPAEISAVRRFLEMSELSVKRQVILETQILEVRLSEGFEAGINWNAIQGQLVYTNNVSTFIGADIINQENPGTEIFSSILKVADIRDLLSLLEAQGSVQVLSSPRISTVNNQKAVIRVGTDEFFVSGIKNDTTSSAATTTNSPEVELTSYFSGISLDVTPQISEDGDVILHIHPIVSEVTDQVKEFTLGDSDFSLPLALRDVRESDSVVRARSGQVVVLGGLMQTSSKALDTKRPWLGYIPIVDTFFKTKSRASSKTELVILLRPLVVGSDTWQREVDKFKELPSLLSQEPKVR
jgi:MSHA biogenesis protein MshL